MKKSAKLSPYEKSIKVLLDKALDLTQDHVQKNFRDNADGYIKAANPELSILERCLESGVIEYQIFKRKRYAIRNLVVQEKGENFTTEILLASEELFDAFGDMENWSTTAEIMDSSIYHYLTPQDFLLSGKEIAEKCLDVEFIFIEEVFG